MRIEDLPPWAQAQAANQIMARQRRGSGRSRAPTPALSDDEEEIPRRAASKYHNRKAARITAAGNILEFDSQKEARRYDELALLLALCAAACAAALLIAAGEPLAALLRTLAEKTGLSGTVFTPLWKVLAIALTVRVGGAFCRDAAQGALASVLETAGAVCALTAAAPLLLAVVELVEGWL